MDNKNVQQKCEIEQLEAYIKELKIKLYNHEVEIAEKDDKISKVFALLDPMNAKLLEVFTELLNKNDQLFHEYNEEHASLLYLQEENECLRFKNMEINKKLEYQKTELQELETIKSTHLADIKAQQKQLSDTMSTAKKFHDKQRLAESELKNKEQDIICIQNSLANKITQYTELEKNLNTEQNRNEFLQSSMHELKMTNEKTVCALQAEITELRSALNENSAKLDAANEKLKEAQDEVSKRKHRTTELKKTIKEMHAAYTKEKNKMDKNVDELKVEVESLSSNVGCINMKLCNSQIESNRLKYQLADQNQSIKLLEATKKRLQQEMERIKESTGLTSTMIIAECEQHDRERQIYKNQLELIAQEECELEQLGKKLTEKIKNLKKKQNENYTNVQEIYN